MSAPTRLRVEYLDDAVLGLGDRTPRLSWCLPAGAARQLAYAVEVDGVNTGRVASDASTFVSWPGEPLGSRQRVQWRVKVWTDEGESEWSESAWFETGLLDVSQWRAQWIEPSESQRSAHVLRRVFSLDAEPGKARIYATAHGVYETYLNGRRVGDVELAPGFTSYPTNLNVQCYDVGDLLVGGDNTWEVVISDGWWRGRFGYVQRTDGYGTTLAFLGQLHAGDAVVVTDGSWESGSGPLVEADLMAGQREDRRVVAGGWSPVSVAEYGYENLRWSPAPPTRRVQTLRPASVTRLGEGRHLVNLGQNINGWLRLADLGPAGTELTIVHGEVLDKTGDVTQEGVLPDMPMMPDLGMTDHVVSSGRAGDVFEPRQTTHGFQYARIEGHPGPLTVDDVEGVVVHTDLRRLGWFRCSDERINKLHDIADWSFRDNACEIPTDCPQRERAGWTGDWQLFAPTAAFLYDVAGFSLKWLRDVAAEQLDDGCVTAYIPDPQRYKDPNPSWRRMQGSAAWGDAVVLVPWEMWRAYGDTAMFTELWPNMVGWMDYAAHRARTRRHRDREAARPEPAPHEEYLWDAPQHFGEWLEPDVTGNLSAEQAFKIFAADHGVVATAFLHRCAGIVAEIARMLGHDDEVARFEKLSAGALDAYRKEYIAADGSLTVDTQATHVRALAWNLVPDELREQTATRLVELVREADTHLGTGFLATPYLLPVLADAGHLDVAYDLLFQNTAPSWLTMVDRGATTVWEQWNGVNEDGVPSGSLNHYSKGAVVTFLHSHVAGIRLLDGHPGYRHFRVQPLPGGGITWAEAVHDSPYGRIESSWRIAEGAFQLTVVVPPGATAEVVLPDGTTTDHGPGMHAVRCATAT